MNLSAVPSSVVSVLSVYAPVVFIISDSLVRCVPRAVFFFSSFLVYFSFELLLNWFFHWIIIIRHRRIVQLFRLHSHAVQLLWAILAAVLLQIAACFVLNYNFWYLKLFRFSCLAGVRASVRAQFSCSHLHFFDNSVVFFRSVFRSVRVYFLIAPLRVWMIAAETVRNTERTPRVSESERSVTRMDVWCCCYLAMKRQN